jgi:hypothetical protein
MSDIPDVNVPHEQAHAKATDAQMARTSDVGPIANLVTPANNNYSQTEQTASANTINQILQVLRDAELIPLA